MTRERPHVPLTSVARDLCRSEAGSTLVEMAVVLPVFLLLFLGLIDFGRLGAEYVMAEKAMQRAARIAAVRPPVCLGVPEFNSRGPVFPGTVPPRFGTGCAFGGGVCTDPGAISCTANSAHPVVTEIWAAVAPLMPTHATEANLNFSYAYDANLGFLGGPYVPIVSVEIQNLDFRFATPLSALAALAGDGSGNTPGATLPFPRMSVSLPAEDLASGEGG